MGVCVCVHVCEWVCSCKCCCVHNVSDLRDVSLSLSYKWLILLVQYGHPVGTENVS